MARRRQTIGGDEGDDNIVDAYTQAYFKRGQQEDPRMTMAMQLMGLQQRQQESALDREEKARAQRAEEMWRSGQLGLQREQLGVTSKEAEAAEKGRQEERAFREGATTRDIQYKREQVQREQEKSIREEETKNKSVRATMINKAAEEGTMSKPEAKRQLLELYPEQKEIAAQMKEEAIGEGVKQNLEAFRSKTPEQRKAMLQNQVAINELGGMDVYNRMVQQLGEQPGVAGAAAAKAPNISVANLLWNTPGGLENIFRGIANVGGRAIYGRDVPQYSYVPWTEVNAAGGGGPPTPVGPPPETPLQPGLGGYGPMVPQEPAPEWQYGVGTLRPPTRPVDEILARARLGQ